MNLTRNIYNFNKEIQEITYGSDSDVRLRVVLNISPYLKLTMLIQIVLVKKSVHHVIFFTDRKRENWRSKEEKK